MLNAKYAIACLAAVVVLGLPLSAGAGIRTNGIRTNGIRTNGTGLQLSPVATQGIVRVEGGRLVIQPNSANQ